MRKIAITLWLAAAAAVLWQTPAKAEKQDLRMAYWGGPSHQMVQTLAAWVKTIEEGTCRRSTVEVDKPPLTKTEGQYNLNRNDVRDLLTPVPGYTVERSDVSQLTKLPLICPKPAVCSPAVWKWYDKKVL